MARITLNKTGEAVPSGAARKRTEVDVPAPQLVPVPAVADEISGQAVFAPTAPPPSGVDQQLLTKSSHSMLSAFCAFPNEVRFAGEEDNEKIILLLRAHLVTNVPWLAVDILLFLAPGLILPLAGLFRFLPFTPSAGLVTVLVVTWYLGAFTYGFLNALYWFFNLYIITDRRIIDVDWHSVVYHHTSFAHLDRVENVNVVRPGVFAGLFDYGNMKVETAGEDANIDFAAIPHPQLVSQKISDLVKKAEISVAGTLE